MSTICCLLTIFPSLFSKSFLNCFARMKWTTVSFWFSLINPLKSKFVRFVKLASIFAVSNLDIWFLIHHHHNIFFSIFFLFIYLKSRSRSNKNHPIHNFNKNIHTIVSMHVSSWKIFPTGIFFRKINKMCVTMYEYILDIYI